MMRRAVGAFLALSFFALAASASDCSSFEKNLASKSVIKMRVVFGYKDARPARYVGDRHERVAFISKITAPCDKVKGACGFVRSADNADLFMKRVETESGKPQKLLLWVVNSSAGTDDQENRSDPFQAWKSRYASQAYFNGLGDADIVFYNGHSRFGGGPDFDPPILDRAGAVDPLPYKEARTGLTKMSKQLAAAKKAKSRLKLMGVFSCSANQHFENKIRESFKGGVLSSRVLMYYADAINESLKALDSIAQNKCPRGVHFN